MIEIYGRHALPTTADPRREQHRDDIVGGESVMPSETLSLRLPLLHMYVFPRRSKTDGVHIPGYWTSITLYEHIDSRSAGPND